MDPPTADDSADEEDNQARTAVPARAPVDADGDVHSGAIAVPSRAVTGKYGLQRSPAAAMTAAGVVAVSTRNSTSTAAVPAKYGLRRSPPATKTATAATISIPDGNPIDDKSEYEEEEEEEEEGGGGEEEEEEEENQQLQLRSVDSAHLVEATLVTQGDLPDSSNDHIQVAGIVDPATEPEPKACCDFRSPGVRWLCFGTLVLITGIAIAMVYIFCSGGSCAATSSSASDVTTTAPTPSPSGVPTSPPSPSPTNGAPSSTPTSIPTANPTVSYSQSILAPNVTSGGTYFDHLDLAGFTSNDASNIHKISQIKVYATTACSTDNNCSLPTSVVLSLVVSYVLKDCTIYILTNGAYTDGDHLPAATINLKREQYVTRMDVLAQSMKLTHIKICTSDDTCFGPFGDSLDVEHNTVFEKDDGVIHSFYGYSGSWLDAVGVNYEHVGDGSMPRTTCV